MTITGPRERWRYLGRETHLRYQYDVYELVAHPRIGYVLGRICAVHVK